MKPFDHTEKLILDCCWKYRSFEGIQSSCSRYVVYTRKKTEDSLLDRWQTDCCRRWNELAGIEKGVDASCLWRSLSAMCPGPSNDVELQFF